MTKTYIAATGHTVELRNSTGGILFSVKAVNVTEARKCLALLKAANPALKIIGPTPAPELVANVKGAELHDDA